MMGAARFTLIVEPLTEAAFAPFGRVLGLPCPPDDPRTAFRSPATDFWHAHHFLTGEGGSPEVLWVDYRNTSGRVQTLEAHWLTQQAIVPLGGDQGSDQGADRSGVVQVVCPSRDDGSRLPDLAQMRAFQIPAGQGICMQPGCWHTTFVTGGPVTCLMLTRASTTRDLLAHLNSGATATESSLVALASLDPREWVVQGLQVSPAQPGPG